MQILHLEDSSNDALLISRVLRREWPNCAIRQVATAEEFRSALQGQTFDVILSDYSMPGFDGLLALAEARSRNPGTPFLFLSGMIGEERAVEALKQGASDYIIKDRPARLVPAIRHALALVHETNRRRHTEETLRQNNERYQLITEGIADLITVLDLAGLRVYSNRASRELLGETAAAVGTDWFEGVEPADSSRVRRAIACIADSGQTERFEYRRRIPDGRVRFIEANGAVLRDATGGVAYVIVVSRDVTERRDAEARLREQASLLDKARDAIMAMDLEHRVTYWNGSAERLYGLRASEVLGQKLETLGLGYDPARFAAARAEVLAKGEWRGDFRLRTGSGATAVVESTWSLVVETDGRPRSILAIDTDVTERKKLETQLLRAHRLESIGTLAGGVAHDLNNVLTPILFTLDLLAGHVAADDDRELIEQTRASARHGAALVGQLLAFARGADGERTRIDPSVVLTTVAPLVRQSMPPAITVTIRHRQPPWPVEANTTQLGQVLVNLALNARDAMPNGGRLDILTDNVVVDAALAAANPGSRTGPHFSVSVSDTGLGIPPTILDRIFDPFFTTKPAGKGTGLGLSMVAGILKSHGGFIQVDSEVGRGTTFRLFLPALSPAPSSARPDVGAALRGRGDGVLLVDDEPAVRETLRLLLQRAGYAVYAVGDGSSALREFEQRRSEISLVITDMMLPDRSGVEVVKTIRVLAPHLPVIAISGMMASGNYDELLRLEPPIQCLAKPLLPSVLLGAAHQALYAQP